MDVNSITTTQDALTLFDALPPVATAALRGFWHGGKVPTGHRMDELLIASGWIGKTFHDDDHVDPLIMRSAFGTYRMNPALALMGPAMALRVDRWPGFRPVFAATGWMLSTHRPRARLRMVEHRGAVSAAMVYDQKPIIDHFRLLEEGRVLGLMDQRGMEKPFFFTLTRAAGTRGLDLH